MMTVQADDGRNRVIIAVDVEKEVANVYVAVVASTGKPATLTSRDGESVDARGVAPEMAADMESLLFDVMLKGRATVRYDLAYRSRGCSQRDAAPFFVGDEGESRAWER
jgi:hypothetical protein